MHEYGLPELPLSKEEFRRALHAGLGRAKMHLAACGVADHRDVILEAALSCQVYDPQCEGLPAAWFAEFCEVLDLVPALLGSAPGGGHWDQAWRFALLKQFAERGHPGAKEALYGSLVETEAGELLGADDLVELEGEAGLFYVARRLGRGLLLNPARDLDDGPVMQFDLMMGKGAALHALESAAVDDAEIRAYFERLSAPARQEPELSRPKPTIHEVIRAILDSKQSALGLAYRARHFTPDEFAPVQELVHTTSDPMVLENGLRFLSGCKTLPFDPTLAPLVLHPEADVRTFAAVALGRHENSLVHDLGLDLLGAHLSVALELLRCNAGPEDRVALLGSLHGIDDVHEQHQVVARLIRLLEGSPRAWDSRFAVYVYEHAPCRVCRETAVEMLIEARECPDWVLLEGRSDASEAIRELVLRNGARA